MGESGKQALHPIGPGLDAYLALQRARPDWFTNSPEGIQIITEPQVINDIETEARRALTSRELPQDWGQVGVVFESEYLLVLRDAVRFQDGQQKVYLRVVNRPERGPGAAILPSYRNNLVLLRIARHATRQVHTEIPRGFGEPTASAAQTAMLELKEELAGRLRSGSLKSLGSMHPNTGVQSDRVELFFAELESYKRVKFHEGIVDVVEYPPVQVEGLIKDGAITDSFTIAAYTRAKLLGLLPS